MKKRITAAVLAAVMTAALLSGCGSNKEEAAVSESSSAAEVSSVSEASSVSEVSSVSEEEEVVLRTFGTEEKDAFEFRMKNSTGMEIKALSFGVYPVEEFPESLIPAGEDAVAKDEEVVVFWKAPEEADSEAAPDEFEITPEYQLQLTFEDDTQKVIHGFPLEDMKECEICLEDEVAFLKYESTSSHEMVNSKEYELAVVRLEEEARAQAEAEELARQQAEAEAAAQAQAEAEAAAAAQAAAEAEAARAQAEAAMREAAQNNENEGSQEQQNQDAGGCDQGFDSYP